MKARKVFTTRRGGVSASPYDSFNLGDHVGDTPEAVASNRERLASVFSLPGIVWMEQIHSPNVTVVGEEAIGTTIEATDALVTTTPGVALAVMVADCVPILLSSEQCVAAVHAGRMGARNGILTKTIDIMRDLGAESIHCLMGPAICGKHYEVPAFMAMDVEEHLPGSQCQTEQGTTGLDLRAGLLAQFVEHSGSSLIDVDWRCTYESPEFFSYRRDTTTGRQAGLVWLEQDNKGR
ncbi:MAG: peptidoglycan editing factor PgeF [Corynebacterium sp.]|nr:peptidoglycan editing factor PgeF [Corynebacterium sp.]